MSAAALLAEDYLFLGERIRAQLDLKLEGAWPVQICERSEQVLAADKRPRVAMVMWAGDRFSTLPTGQVDQTQLLYQQWAVVLAVNNVGKQLDSRLGWIGAALFAAHKALHGWKPDGLTRPFTRTTARIPPLFTESKAVFPLAFEIPLHF